MLRVRATMVRVCDLVPADQRIRFGLDPAATEADHE
jgi:hypothetical protein